MLKNKIFCLNALMLFNEKNKEWEMPGNHTQSKIIKRFMDFKCNSKVLNIQSDCLLFLNDIEEYGRFDNIITSNISIEDIILQTIKVDVKSIKQCCEGEITDIRSNDEYIEVDLMTTKESRTIRLNKNIQYQLENIFIGDILYAEPTMGVVRKLGRSENKRGEFDLKGCRYLPITRTQVFREKEKEITVSLLELKNSLGDILQVEKYINENIQNILFKDTSILVKCKLTNESTHIIDKFTKGLDCVKFVLFNQHLGKNFLSLKLLTVKPEEMFVFYAKENVKKITEESLNAIKNIIDDKNVEKLHSLLKISNDSEDFYKKIKLFFYFIFYPKNDYFML